MKGDVIKSTKVDVKKALQLRLKGLSYNDIAKQQGCSSALIQYHLKPLLPALEHTESLTAFQSHKAEVFDAIQSRLVGSLLDKDKIQKATLSNVAYSMRQLNDMSRLEQDKSTSNVSIAHIDAIETIREVDIEIDKITRQLDPNDQADSTLDIYKDDKVITQLEEEIKRITAGDTEQDTVIIDDSLDPFEDC